MAWENLEGGQEASHHTGEAYRKQVRDYLEAGEFLEIGDPHSGTSDIRLARPAHSEDKIFRVETKNTKASLYSDSFINELARHFIDFHYDDEDFDLYIFAEAYANTDKWRHIFDGPIRREQTVEEYFERIASDHNLSEAEARKFDDLGVDEFRHFIENIKVKRATYGRLGELIDERESEQRRSEQWSFYVDEHGPISESERLTPNFVKISQYPDQVWTLPSPTTDYESIYEEVPRYLPVWFEGDTTFSLISPDRIDNRLQNFIDPSQATPHDFKDWINRSEGTDHHRRVTALLNRQLTWRGTFSYDQCICVRHDGTNKLIFKTDSTTTQTTLLGDTELDSSDRETRIDGYVVTKDMGNAIAHRYSNPHVKRYGGDFFMFIKTGWLFTKTGHGATVITGDWATKLHNKLDKQRFARNSNLRSQIHQWAHYLRIPDLTVGEDLAHRPEGITEIAPAQLMRFEEPGDLELRVRPPYDSDERQQLMEGNL